MRKQSYAVQMSHQVSEAKKEQAKKAITAFDTTMKTLRSANDHLDIMFTPFKDHPDISTEQVVKFRAALRRFRDKAIENFNQFKIQAFHCYTLMVVFSSDTQTSKLMKSFISAIEDIEKYVNEFSELFAELESKSFVQDVTKDIEKIHKESDALKEIIEDRIKNHIQKNIIGKNWIDSVSDELSVKVEENKPIMMDLLSEQRNGTEDTDK